MNDGEGPETFFARQERQKAKGINGNGMGMPLTIAATIWPTPSLSDLKGGPSGTHIVRSDGTTQSRETGGSLAYAAEQLWAPPSVADTTGGRMTRSGDRSNEPLLKGQAAILSDHLATPRSHEVGDYQYSRGDKTKPVLTLTGQASFHQVHPTYQVGQVSSHPRRSLNPLFVEWLMGWPPGWTLLAWTDFACSAMALFLWKQRMRFALLSLVLPPPAPQMQLSFLD